MPKSHIRIGGFSRSRRWTTPVTAPRTLTNDDVAIGQGNPGRRPARPHRRVSPRGRRTRTGSGRPLRPGRPRARGRPPGRRTALPDGKSASRRISARACLHGSSLSSNDRQRLGHVHHREPLAEQAQQALGGRQATSLGIKHGIPFLPCARVHADLYPHLYLIGSCARGRMRLICS